MKTGTLRIAVISSAAMMLAAVAAPALADTIAYIGYQSGKFGTIDLTTGAITVINSNLGVSPAGFGVVGTTLYTAGYTSGNLYTVDPSTGAVTLVGNSPGISYHDFGSTPNGLYGDDFNLVPHVYSVNATSGAATDLGSSGVVTAGSGAYRALSTATESTTLYLAANSNLYTVDPNTGAATEVGSFGSNIVMTSLLVEGGTLFGADESGNFYTIDASTGVATADAAIANVGGAVWALAPISAVAPPPPVGNVPEPATLVLLGVGVLALGFSRRRKFA